MKTARRRFGDEGEAAAAAFLARRGFRVLARNVRVPRVGEIDIVALDPTSPSGLRGASGGTLVFVEVKTRRNDAFGPPEEAVTPAKLRTLAACAEAWRNATGWRDRPYRIDVVAVDLAAGRGDIRHLKGVALD